MLVPTVVVVVVVDAGGCYRVGIQFLEMNG